MNNVLEGVIESTQGLSATLLEKGPKGETGPYYVPSVDEEGNLSWTNTGNLENPETVNIKGADGTVAFDELTEEQRASLKGEKGDTGNSGVYIGTEEPTDANVWIDPTGEVIDVYTKAEIDAMIGEINTELENIIDGGV